MLLCTTPERVLWVKVLNTSFEHSIKHFGRLVGPIEGDELRGDCPLLLQNGSRISADTLKSREGFLICVQGKFVVAQIFLDCCNIDEAPEGVLVLVTNGSSSISEDPHPEGELVAKALEFTKGDRQVDGRHQRELAVWFLQPVSSFQNVLAKWPSGAELFESEEHVGKIELGAND